MGGPNGGRRGRPRQGASGGRRRGGRLGARGRGRRDRRPAPRDRLALDVSPGPARRRRGAAVRFQDASPDARAVVYAGIQADPLVARAAALLADATQTQRILARAVMNGMSTGPTVWQAMFPTLFGPDAPSDGDERGRSEALLAASIQVAERGEQVRSQVRGALVEALTELLIRRRTGSRGGPSAVRRERRILFDGVRAEIHPYDVTLEAPGAAE